MKHFLDTVNNDQTAESRDLFILLIFFKKSFTN